MRGSSLVWPGITLALAGVWFFIDGGGLRVQLTDSSTLGVGSTLGLVLFLSGVIILVLSHSTSLRDHVTLRRIPRKSIVVVGVVFVVLLVLGNLFAAGPLVTRDYTVTVITAPGGPGPPFNDSGSANLNVPAGATLTGSWAAPPGPTVAILVDYGSCYGSPRSSTSLSFNLAGSSPYVYPPGQATPVLFEVLSVNPITVTICGTYTVPALYL